MAVLKSKREKLASSFQLDTITFTLLNYSVRYLNSTKVVPKKYNYLFIKPIISNIIYARRCIKYANSLQLNQQNFQERQRYQKNARDKILESLNLSSQMFQLFHSDQHKIDVFSKYCYHADCSIKKWMKSDKERIKIIIQKNKEIQKDIVNG